MRVCTKEAAKLYEKERWDIYLNGDSWWLMSPLVNDVTTPHDSILCLNQSISATCACNVMV